jgi:hypothetical protein
MEMSDTYKIVRHYQRNYKKRTIQTGLTLKQAQEYCKDPNTSSRTCTTAAGIRRTKSMGPWFDAYDKE